MKVSRMKNQLAGAVTKRRLGAVVVALGAWLVSASATAATMETIEFASLPGDRTEIRMTFDGTPPTPKGYTIESPARIALDLEASGADKTVAVIETDLDISRARIIDELNAQDMEARIVTISQDHATDRRAHLLVIEGFIDAKDERFSQFQNNAGNSVQRVAVLGAYPPRSRLYDPTRRTDTRSKRFSYRQIFGGESSEHRSGRSRDASHARPSGTCSRKLPGSRAHLPECQIILAQPGFDGSRKSVAVAGQTRRITGRIRAQPTAGSHQRHSLLRHWWMICPASCSGWRGPRERQSDGGRRHGVAARLRGGLLRGEP